MAVQVKLWVAGLYNSWTVRLLQLRMRIMLLWNMVVDGVSSILITLLAATFGTTALYIPASQKALSDFDAVETVLTSMGATFGTILALVLTLSIIPIQRAGEAWSPSIVRLYRRDSLTHLTFIVLGIFCVASFLLAVNDVSGIPGTAILVSSFVALGASLDLLRWYHRHICQLLDPSHAVGTVTKYARNAIDHIQRSVSKVARLQYRSLSAKQKLEVKLPDLEMAIYPQVSGYPNTINYWVRELAEIANKGVSRGEKFLANTAIIGIRDIVTYYLTARKNNLALYSAPDVLFLVTESDVKVVVNPAYETLQEVSRTSVTTGDESTAIRVSEALGGIAIYSANLQSPRFRTNTAPLTATPIAYLLSCVKYAQEKGFDDVPFQSAEVLSRISLAAPKNIAYTDVHIPVIDGIQEIALQFYAKRNATLAEYVIDYPMAVLNKVFDGEEYHFRDLLRHVLEKLEILAPFAVVNEALQGRLSMVYPLGKAYGLTNSRSLGYLFMKTNQLIKIDTDREWVNPYHDVVEILDIYQRHFRNIGEQVEFGESFLLWELTQLIKYIAIAVGQMVEKPLREGRNDEQALVDKLQWVMSFFWVAFDKKNTVNPRRADEAGDVLAYVGIIFFERGYPDVLKSNVSHIRSVINSYCQHAQPLNEYAVGDLFAHLWCMRALTIARDNTALTVVIDKAINTKPESINDDQWQRVQHAIELRRAQLVERLEERNRRYGRDTSEELLRSILEGNGD